MPRPHLACLTHMAARTASGHGRHPIPTWVFPSSMFTLGRFCFPHTARAVLIWSGLALKLDSPASKPGEDQVHTGEENRMGQNSLQVAAAAAAATRYLQCGRRERGAIHLLSHHCVICLVSWISCIRLHPHYWSLLVWCGGLLSRLRQCCPVDLGR
ncbi:hypothetical protein LY76DRAFT_375187 [Colletotrichum caudatum]|nr:hypothetical protein LY76DRAFT_375187 [Colletotrichum caudatum]